MTTFCITLTLLAVAFIAYVLFGYPLLLAAVSKRHSRPVHRAPFQPTVSILVAVHNGEAFLEAKLRSILALDYPKDRIEILIASDGSTDHTASIARQFSPQGVRLLELPRGGKPAALNAAIAQATGEILIFTDVRQRLAPDSLALLLENFADPTVGAASAELVIQRANRQEENSVSLYWRYEFWIRIKLSQIDSIFGATGAYYALRHHLAVPIPTTALLDDMHLPLAAFFQGYRLIVDPRARMFDYPTALHSEFWRKVRTLAGNYQILVAYPQLLSPANRMWVHFVSYKFARLALPFALLAILGASWAWPDPWRSWLLSAQVGVYGLAALDFVLPESPLKRLTSPLRTFFTLMAASLCALPVYLSGNRAVWRQTNVSAPAEGTRERRY